MSKICVPAMLNVGSKTVNQASFCMTISPPGTCVSLYMLTPDVSDVGPLFPEDLGYQALSVCLFTYPNLI